MKKHIACIAFLFYSICLIAQNKVTISGFVYDSSTAEILIGATIFEKNTKKGAISNEYGFYSLSATTNDSLEIVVSFIGYKNLNIKIPGGQKGQTNFRLIPFSITLNEFTVTASAEESSVKKNETGVVRLQMKEISTLPNLFGEVDIIKAFQLTPGVQSGGEAKSEIYVRGGGPDQNLILLDDVPLYYISHFGGFFSIFNSDAINDVKLTKGGFPARYGSRLSSVLDVRMKEGNMQNMTIQGTIGLLSSRLSIEAPLISNKMSYIISARKNMLPIFKMLGAGVSFNFYDLNAKLNYRISEKDKLFLSFYNGDDDVTIKEATEFTKNKSQTRWGNTLMAFRWNHVYNNKLFSNLTLSKTNYRYQNKFAYSISNDSLSRNLISSLFTGINDLGAKLDYTYHHNSNYNLRFGANAIWHTFFPNDESYEQTGSDISPLKHSYTDKSTALESAIYMENEINLKHFSANLGIRHSAYITGKTHYQSLEPRVLLNYIIREDWALKYSFSKSRQYIHLLTYSGVGIPSDYWMPSNENVKPENSIQHALNLTHSFGNNMYEASLETYYKTLDNLISFLAGESLSGNFDTWENVIEKNGKGLNYGIELFVQKKLGKTTGWIGVTASRAERTFATVNEGKTFPFKYDRLLDISIAANHRLKKNIVLSATWTFGSGYPITLAKEYYNINGEDILVYSDMNSFRMRDYHRLDVSANFHKQTKWGERTWSVSIFNLYNRQNPYYYYYKREQNPIQISSNGYTFSSIPGELKLYQRSLFSFFPSISYSFKFKNQKS